MTRLFLGMPFTHSSIQALEDASPPFFARYIQQEPSAYLQKIEWEGQIYLGKSAESPIQLDALELLENNIVSLLRKLGLDAPSYSLLLFAQDESKA